MTKKSSLAPRLSMTVFDDPAKINWIKRTHKKLFGIQFFGVCNVRLLVTAEAIKKFL